LPYKHKIVIAGNHELSFDEKFLHPDSMIDVEFDANAVHEYLRGKQLTKMKDILVNCTYLEDSETTVFGLRVYGSPWYDGLYPGVMCDLLFMAALCNRADHYIVGGQGFRYDVIGAKSARCSSGGPSISPS